MLTPASMLTAASMLKPASMWLTVFLDITSTANRGHALRFYIYIYIYIHTCVNIG